MIADRGGWRYYNHALLPNAGPHEEPDLQALSDKKSWISEKGRAFFASWVTDFDCEMPTEWWYCIKDEPFDISKLKAKRRYEITKGKRYLKSEGLIRQITQRKCTEYSSGHMKHILRKRDRM